MSGIAGSIRRARQKVRPRRDCGGFAGHGRGALDDRAGAEGFGVAGVACERAGAPRGRGRKPLTEADPTLISDLEALVEPDSRGDPMSPLRWTCKSLRVLAVELGKLGRQISRTVVGELLCMPTARPRKAVIIPIATRSLASSTRRRKRRWPKVNRSFPWTRRKRSWSGISRTRGANGGPRGISRMCASTIS